MKKEWIDESGNIIPANRVTSTEKLIERYSAKIVKTAKDVNNRLLGLKEMVETYSIEVYERVLADKGIDASKRKGNFSWYNFDRSVKIEISINENIIFDEMLLAAAFQKFNSFIKANVQTELDFIKDLIIDAFQSKKGLVDPKKVFNLIRYKDRTKNNDYLEGVKILEESYRKVFSKIYSRVWVKNDNGEYQPIELNYSSIKTPQKDTNAVNS